MWHSITNIVRNYPQIAIRQPRLFALLDVLGGLGHVYTATKEAMQRLDIITAYNGQVCYLRDALRQAFAPSNPEYIELDEPLTQLARIYLFNQADEGDDIYFFNEADEANPLYEDVYLYNQIDFVSEAHFYILINHASLLSNQAQADMNSLIARYAQAGKNWVIINNT